MSIAVLCLSLLRRETKGIGCACDVCDTTAERVHLRSEIRTIRHSGSKEMLLRKTRSRPLHQTFVSPRRLARFLCRPGAMTAWVGRPPFLRLPVHVNIEIPSGGTLSAERSPVPGPSIFPAPFPCILPDFFVNSGSAFTSTP